MPRTTHPPEMDLLSRLNQLSATGEGAPDLPAKLALLTAVRAQSPEAFKWADRFLVEEVDRLAYQLREAQAAQAKLRALHETLTAPPWHPAVYLGSEATVQGPRAMVLCNGARRVVALGEGVDPAELAVGDEVLLATGQNVVMSPSPFRQTEAGETAVYDRTLPDGRVVLRWRDEELVADAAGALDGTALRSGDVVRFDRRTALVYERIPPSRGAHLFLEETPKETFADIGGLDRQIERLQRAIRLHFHHADMAARYRLPRCGSVLLYGPPGTGKTMLAKALSNWLAQLSPCGRSRFIHVKPAALHSMWFGMSEANYREVFRVAREAAAEHPEMPVVMFFDELDAIASARGQSHMRVDDRVLTALMAELDGLEGRGNILVVGATNRPDALDAGALRPGRFGDEKIEVPRPNRDATRRIFAKVFREDVPYWAGGHGDPGHAREAILDAAVSRVFAPNGQGELATLTFRDGGRRPVKPSYLVTGAVIAKIARSATERACLRDVEEAAANGGGGIRLEDVLSALEEEFEGAARVLTPANCHRHLDGMPQDLDVVRVEPVRRAVRQAHRYLTVV